MSSEDKNENENGQAKSEEDLQRFHYLVLVPIELL